MRFVVHGLVTLALSGAIVAACTDQTNPAFPVVPDDGVPRGEANSTDPLDDAATPVDTRDSGTRDASPKADASPADAGLTGKCADTFGDKLTTGFGRIDGIVYAVQKPSDTQCTLPNDDHVIVQVLMGSAVYRLVVNVQSDRIGKDPEVRYAVLPHALPPPAFAEGWHTDVALDYPTTLGAHNDAFTPFAMDQLVAKIAGELNVGDPVSVYAQSTGRPESAHLVHRNKNQKDGAIVVSPTSSPKFLLFHFDGQVF